MKTNRHFVYLIALCLATPAFLAAQNDFALFTRLPAATQAKIAAQINPTLVKVEQRGNFYRENIFYGRNDLGAIPDPLVRVDCLTGNPYRAGSATWTYEDLLQPENLWGYTRYEWNDRNDLVRSVTRRRPGSGDSAVCRYEYRNDTLVRIVDERGITEFHCYGPGITARYRLFSSDSSRCATSNTTTCFEASEHADLTYSQIGEGVTRRAKIFENQYDEYGRKIHSWSYRHYNDTTQKSFVYDKAGRVSQVAIRNPCEADTAVVHRLVYGPGGLVLSDVLQTLGDSPKVRACYHTAYAFARDEQGLLTVCLSIQKDEQVQTFETYLFDDHFNWIFRHYRNTDAAPIQWSFIEARIIRYRE